MTDQTLPEPLVPADVDLRGLEYMPLLGHHLYGSEFDALASDAEYRAGERLWWAAWNQQPAGSLPNNDKALCRFAGKGDDVKRWLKLKPVAMRGFVLCSDGRLYHQFLCRQVLIAWEKRQADRLKNEAENRRKKAEREQRSALFDQLKAAGVTPPWNIPTTELRQLVAQHVTPPDPPPSPPPVTRTSGVTVTPDVTAKTGRDGTGRKEKEMATTGVVAGARPPAEPPTLALVAPPKPPKSEVPDCPHQAVLDLWREVLPHLPQHTEWGATRQGHLRARWREKAVEKGWTDQAVGLVFFRRLFAYVGESRFLTGRAKPREGQPPFEATLAWLVEPEHWAKVIEGNFHREAA